MISAALSPMPLSVTVKTSRTRPRCRARGAHIEPHAAALGELHRIVDEVFQRRPQADRVADQELRQIVGDAHRRAEALGLRPRAERIAENFNQTPRPEDLVLQPQRAGVGPGAVDHQTRERGEMLGAAFDAGSPTPLAFAEIGAGQQFAERQDAGKRRANVVRVSRQRSFADANRRRAPPASAPRRFGGRLFRPQSRRSSPVPWQPRAACHGGGKNEMNSASRSSADKPDHAPDIRCGCAGGPQFAQTGRLRRF